MQNSRLFRIVHEDFYKTSGFELAQVFRPPFWDSILPKLRRPFGIFYTDIIPQESSKFELDFEKNFGASSLDFKFHFNRKYFEASRETHRE